MKIIVGIEGGASFSKSVLIQEDGRVLAESKGSSLNYFLDGVELVFKRVLEHIENLKQQSAVHVEKIHSLGLCLSGCEDESANRKLEEKFLKQYPDVADNVSVASDVIGSIYTVTHDGALVLISGTGSNCFLLNPDGTTNRCGGWGHLIGDEGSGYLLSQRAIKSIIDHDDNFKRCEFDVEPLRKVIYDHFDIKENVSFLKFFYTQYNKPFIAQLSKKISETARNGDKLSQSLFRDLGIDLGQHVLAVRSSIASELLEKETGLKIICVGSVFLSWDLLEDGFRSIIDDKLERYTCYKLTKSSAFGAAYFAASKNHIDLAMDFSGNSEVFYRSCS